MNTFVRIFLVAILITCNTAYAITPQSIYGGSGMGLMRTADILPEGESAYSFSTQIEEYVHQLTPGITDLHIETLISTNLSLGGHSEIGFVAPYSLYKTGSASLYSGTRGVSAFLKHSFTEPTRKQGLGVAISMWGDLVPTDPTNNLGSGEPLYGTEFNISHWSQTTGFHLNMGYSKGQYWKEATLPVYTTGNLVTLSAGMETGLSDSLVFALQALFQREISGQDDNILLSTVFSYATSNRVNFQLGLSHGFPDDRSSPNTNIMFALNYSPSSKQRSRYKVQGTGAQLYDQNTTILKKLDIIESRLSEMESKLTTNGMPVTESAESSSSTVSEDTVAMADSGVMNEVPATSGKLKIEIINTTKNVDVSERVETKLREAGYDVISITSVPEERLDQSVIHYFSGLAEDAKKIGHMFPGDQVVVKRTLPEGVDFRFYIGSDLVK